jgi:hypothetical protein
MASSGPAGELNAGNGRTAPPRATRTGLSGDAANPPPTSVRVEDHT